jgi:hypothetical protein
MREGAEDLKFRTSYLDIIGSDLWINVEFYFQQNVNMAS